jgi:hypothetical protein
VPMMGAGPSLTTETLLAANLVSGVWAGVDSRDVE